MRVLSFDIGIVNLAFCLLDLKEDKTYDIIEWQNIDLINTNNTCDKCEEKAKFVYNQNRYLCKNHKNEYKKEELIKEEYKMEQKSGKCMYETKKGICDKKSNCRTNNISLCTTHTKSFYKKLDKNYTLQTIKKTNAYGLKPIEVKMILIRKLDEYKEIMLNVDYVVIENQLGITNPKMKAASETVYSYFVLRGMIDQDKIKDVIYMSPMSKIMIKKEDYAKVKALKKKSEKKKLTKQLPQDYTIELLKNRDKELIEFFNSNDKKDDLADCFIQGLCFMKKNKMLDTII